MAPVRVLVAVQQPALRRALTAYVRSLPGVYGARAVSSLDEVLQAVYSGAVDVVALDADLWGEASSRPPGVSLDDWIVRLHSICHDLHVVILANDSQQQQRSQLAGADAALLKGSLDEQLRQAIVYQACTLS